MRSIILLCLFISSLHFLKGQNPPLQWVSSVGSNTVDRSMHMTVDGGGNVYSTGSFQGTVDVDPGPSTYILASNGVTDIYIIKQDAAGNLLWATAIGSSGEDEGTCVSINTSGELLVTGYYSGITDFDPSPATYTVGNFGWRSAFVLKLNSSGSFVWVRTYSSNGENEAWAVSWDNAGNIYLTGGFSGTVDFDPGAGTYSLSATNLKDIFITKIDAAGNFNWAVGFGGAGSADDIGFGLAIDGSGNIITSAIFRGTVDFDPGPATFTLASSNVWSTVNLKLSNTGNFIWAKKIGGSADNFCTHVVTDSQKNVYTAGNFEGTTDFDPGTATFNITSYGGRDMYVTKLDSIGNFIWAGRMGGTSWYDMAADLTIDALGNLFLTGAFDGVTDFDPSTGTYSLTSYGGNSDAFIAKLDLSGNLAWAVQVGGTGWDQGQSIKADASGNIYVSGWFSSTTDFYPGPMNYFLSATGQFSDAFVMKFGACTSQPAPPSDITGSGMRNICSGGSTTLSANGYGYINWYNTASGGTPIATSNNLITPTLAAGTYTYYTETTSSCGTSLLRTPITVTVNSLPVITVNSGSICAGDSFSITATGAASYTFQYGSPVVSPSTTTTYSVTGTSSLGCVPLSVTYATVTVYPIPLVTANSGSICSGNSITINPSGAASYSISGGNFVLGPTVTTSYSVTGTSVNGCSSGAPVIITVSVFPTPTITVNSGTICNGNSFTLSPSGAATYTYSSGQVVSPGTTTSYTVSGMSVNGCINTTNAVATITVLPAAAIIASGGTLCEGNTFSIAPTGGVSYTFVPSGPVVSPSINTSYSVTGTNSSGCISSTPTIINLTVHPAPQIICNSGTICAGGTFFFAPSGADSYSISGNTFTVTPSTSTNYTITGASQYGCPALNPAIASITVLALPAVQVVSGNTLICAGSQVTLTASGALSYTWNTGAQTATVIMSPAVTTSYSVTGVNAKGCSASASLTQIVDQCSGISGSTQERTIKIYPNPASTLLFISSDKTENVPFKYYLINNLGQVVLEGTFKETTTVDLTILANGVYSVIIVTGDKTLINRLFKN